MTRVPEISGMGAELARLLEDAVAGHQQGDLERAEAGYRRILEAVPEHADALHLLGLVLLHRDRGAEAASLIQRAVAAHPDAALYRNSLGLALLALENEGEAAQHFEKAVSLRPDYVEAWINLGRALRRNGQRDRALASFARAADLDPGSAAAQAQLGRFLGETGEPEKAVGHLERALALDPEAVSARHDLAGVLHDLGRLAAAEAVYAEAIRRRPDSAEAHNNLGTVFHDQGRATEAEACYRRALTLDPRLAEAHNNLGNLLQDAGEMAAAAACYEKAIALDPGFARAWNNLGMACHETGRGPRAVACFRKALEIDPGYAEACAHLVHQLQRSCDWEALPEAERRLDAFTERALAQSLAVAEQPFVSLVRGTPAQRQFAIARSWALRAAGPAGQPDRWRFPERLPDRRAPLTIGYLSANFRNHPMAHLMAGLFEHHDRRRFKIHAYAYGPDDQSVYRRRIADGCDRFVDIDALGHDAAAARIHDDGVDILVDLMGHTHKNRMAICAKRPAPLQIRYLGLAGTTGADFFDYQLCDAVVVPPELAVHYSEAPLYMPHCYQVNDHRQPVSERIWTRAEAGLPAAGAVLCCFNHAYKIDPEMFDAWMAVLDRVPGSVLWLLATAEDAAENLAARAAQRGMDPRRLVFAPKLPKTEHLARLKLADLGLDTRRVSGAATTSDALWAGVPVVTLAGNQFASRMSASILSAVGLSDLVTDSRDAFVSLASTLAADPLRLERLKQRLAGNKKTAPLFDTARFVRDLETGLSTVWERRCRGLAPEPVYIGADR